jgi:hypothetical protein
MSKQLFNLGNLIRKLRIQTLYWTSCDRTLLLTKSDVHLHKLKYILAIKASNLLNLGSNCLQ